MARIFSNVCLAIAATFEKTGAAIRKAVTKKKKIKITAADYFLKCAQEGPQWRDDYEFIR